MLMDVISHVTIFIQSESLNSSVTRINTENRIWPWLAPHCIYRTIDTDSICRSTKTTNWSPAAYAIKHYVSANMVVFQSASTFLPKTFLENFWVYSWPIYWFTCSFGIHKDSLNHSASGRQDIMHLWITWDTYSNISRTSQIHSPIRRDSWSSD